MERFGRGEKNLEIATALRVSERSVEWWRRAWRERGETGADEGLARPSAPGPGANRQAGA
ncbi:hypothetical protein ACH4U6_37110 [Streptomyces netropsis]|uniref:hypothetical protein n=1 Tax=Streptomyces netropsis TaxID=55404 RepID=UPI0037963AB0